MAKSREDIKINEAKASKRKADYLIKAVDQKVGKATYIEEQKA